ncbi:hypothetical protein NDN08_002767 [Rhodosorus marinus]|uniref:Sodium/calcium exchanger membrane region domain-containing protein n=1 Tax=Rhodosorus marinus TaxID=101924 RepID=A0AAV8UUT5_9RHOD|nr:hypothetical protein NDN08_002767 [Rhodosorus marinus]
MKKDGRNGNIKTDEVKRAYFSANPPETNEAHDLEEHELEARSSMVRRQTLTSGYGATNNEEISKQAVEVQRVNSNPVYSNLPCADEKTFLRGDRSRAGGKQSAGKRLSSGYGGGHVHMSQISQYTEGVRDGLSGLEGYWSTLNYLLIFVPLGILTGFFGAPKVLVFILNFVGCVPLATILGKATEDLATHTNATVGGLLNATFGNAVEIILSIAALRQGLLDVIRYTLVGSILSNLLLVLGSSFFFGGLIYREQEVHKVVAESNADLLVAASFGFALPSVFGVALPEGKGHERVAEIFSLVTAVCLLLIYAMFLYFQLFTHYDSYLDEEDEEAGGSRVSVTDPTAVESESLDGGEEEVEADDEEEVVASFNVAFGILLVVVVLVSICSEYIVSSISEFSQAAGLGQTFVSIIFLPVIGNAVEHFSAVMVAMKDKMDLSIGIACGSSVQIAAFASPVMVILSWIFGQNHLTLDVGIFNSICIVMSVFLVNTTMRDSQTNWLEGALLLTVYVVIGCALFLFDQV